MPALNPSQFQGVANGHPAPEHLACPKCGASSWNEASRDSHVEKWHAERFTLPQRLSGK